MRTVRIEQFEGPLDLLLELILDAKLDISAVSLAAVTEQYLDALASAEGLSTEELADFLVVAARLLLVKSKTLLPGVTDADDESVSLEAQLRLYQRFVGASRLIRRELAKRRTLYPREHPLVATSTFLPPRTVTSGSLAAAFRLFLLRVEPPVRVTPDIVRRTVSLKEKIQHIRALLAAREQVNFRELLAAASSRTEIIVTFLALLELVKQRAVAISQDALFEDIAVTPNPDADPA